MSEANQKLLADILGAEEAARFQQQEADKPAEMDRQQKIHALRQVARDYLNPENFNPGEILTWRPHAQYLRQPGPFVFLTLIEPHQQATDVSASVYFPDCLVTALDRDGEASLLRIERWRLQREQ
ncbi:MAG: hypothetical protein JJU06_05980 [Ectothiorhodospiraceae bacterium]|nr:hypothetical protein [Ectothiorhodospiraceae bacterium]